MITEIARVNTRDYALCQMCGGFGWREFSCPGNCETTWPHFHCENCECRDDPKWENRTAISAGDERVLVEFKQ